MNYYVLFFGICIFSFFQFFSKREFKQSPGILVESAPEQKILPPEEKQILFEKDVLQPLAKYTIKARILAKKRYYLDAQSKYAPWDFALGWKSMSDNNVLKNLKIRQSGRFYFIIWANSESVDRVKIFSESANTHIIPSTPKVQRLLKRARVGQIIKLKGLLVRIDMVSGAEWKSSLTRLDTGAGACELMYVQEAEIL